MYCSSCDAVTGSSFQKRSPLALIASVTGGIFSDRRSRPAIASGSLTTTLCVISGAVIMKMISSTSITSTRGVTLMSAIGPPPLPELNAMAVLLVWLGA